MHEQLGTLHGDKGGNPDKEALLQPAAVRYLLSSALPLTDLKKVGEEKLRELRTLACSLDLLVSGRVGAAGDHMMQRMKSILMGMGGKSLPGAHPHGGVSHGGHYGRDGLCPRVGSEACQE